MDSRHVRYLAWESRDDVCVSTNDMNHTAPPSDANVIGTKSPASHPETDARSAPIPARNNRHPSVARRTKWSWKRESNTCDRLVGWHKTNQSGQKIGMAAVNAHNATRWHWFNPDCRQSFTTTTLEKASIVPAICIGISVYSFPASGIAWPFRFPYPNVRCLSSDHSVDTDCMAACHSGQTARSARNRKTTEHQCDILACSRFA